MPIALLHRDAALLVVDKPSGMLVHRGWGRDPVVLVDEVRELTGLKTVHPLGRLDRGASGAVLFALDADTARELQKGDVERRYLVVVRGEAPLQGEIDHPIPRRPGGPRVEAQTTFRRLATAQCEPRSVSLVLAVPRTGRLHQVRRHLKHINHPVVGDANYGKGALNRALRERYGLARLALHAAVVILTHPVTSETLRVVAPLPEDLAIPFGRMGLEVETTDL